jgi:diguanylate cyclase (GGDEF)-like protein
LKNLAAERRRAATTPGRARRGPNSKSTLAESRNARNQTADLSSRLRARQRTLRERVESRATLLGLVRAVTATVDPVAIAEAVIDRASALVPVTRWALVSDDPSGQVSILAERGLPPELEASAHHVGRLVMARGVEFATGDLSREPRAGASLRVAVLAFPLACRGRAVGALIGIDRGPSARAPEVPPSLARGLRTLFEPAAAALDTAVRLKRAEGLSVTDDLTNLYNSRFLNQVLRREAKRASRGGRPLSLLFLDLDDFKNVNDRHGHLAGSRALVEAAEVIRGSARETDVVARFGGDEFALVLPDTGGKGAFAVGERIRDRMAAHPFLAADGLDVRLTVSVGVATLPDAALGAEELVRAADAAMYRIKDRGKNGIEAAAAPADT